MKHTVERILEESKKRKRKRELHICSSACRCILVHIYLYLRIIRFGNLERKNTPNLLGTSLAMFGGPIVSPHFSLWRLELSPGAASAMIISLLEQCFSR